MLTKELAQKCNKDVKAIRMAVMRASAKSQNYIIVDGVRYTFDYIEEGARGGSGGKVLQFQESIKITEKPISKSTETKITKKEKPTKTVAITQFITSINSEDIVKYATLSGKSNREVAIDMKISRYVVDNVMKKYRLYGIDGVGDMRGKNPNAKKIDDEMVRVSILSCGSRHINSMYHYYCVMGGIGGRSSYYRVARELIMNDKEVRAYLKDGLDGIKFSTPSAPNNHITVRNEQWQIDATKLDIMCLKDGEPVRVTAIAVIDVATGFRVWGLFDSPNSYANVRLLKKAINILGVPTVIKGDNGKDYVSEHFQSVLKHLNILYVNTPKGEGRAKGKIERNFKTVQHSPLFENLPGFIGHNPGERIEIENQEITKLERFGGVKTYLKDLLTYEELEVVIDRIIDDMNIERGFDGIAIGSIENIDARLGKREMRKLSKEGIKWNNRIYLSLELWSFCGYRIGQDVMIVEDIDDISRIYLWVDDRCIILRDSNVVNISVEEWRTVQKDFKTNRINPLMKHIKQLKTEKNEAYKEVVNRYVSEAKPIIEEEKEKLDKKIVQLPVGSVEIEVVNKQYKPYRPSLDELIAEL